MDGLRSTEDTSLTGSGQDPEQSARRAGLRYVHDGRPGYTRRKFGRGFAYYDTRGKKITDEQELARIRSLAIPPAWTDVWICPDPKGHLQVTARDDRRRKQYRYHPQWNAMRNRTKFDHLQVFGEHLPLLRRRTREQLLLPGMPREKVLAVVVTLLETTLIRIGNAEYSRTNSSYGLTTMLNEHVQVHGSTIEFSFRGKSGKHHKIDVRNRRLASIVRRCQELPGQELFGYMDEEGNPVDVESADVNDYLRDSTGQDITAKDFRTWGGTLHALTALCSAGACDSETERKRSVVRAVRETASHLGNTAATCKKYYIHSAVLTAYERGSLIDVVEHCRDGTDDGDDNGLSVDEQILLRFLREHAGRFAAE